MIPQYLISFDTDRHQQNSCDHDLIPCPTTINASKTLSCMFSKYHKGSTAHCSAQMKQIEYEDFSYLLKFPESLTFLLSSQFVPCFLPYSKEDYSYIALPLTKAGAVTILMEYTRAPKGIEQMLVTQSHSNSMRRSYLP